MYLFGDPYARYEIVVIRDKLGRVALRISDF